MEMKKRISLELRNRTPAEVRRRDVYLFIFVQGMQDDVHLQPDRRVDSAYLRKPPTVEFL